MAAAAAAAAASKWRNGVFAFLCRCGRLSGWLAHGWLYICVYEHCAREREREWGRRAGAGARSLRRIIQIFIFPIAKHECARESRSRNDGSLMRCSLHRPLLIYILIKAPRV